MRELKFRAWDEDAGRFRTDISIRDGIAESSWGKEKPEWIVEQFTGLLDKNGKAIFEGDILGGIIGLPIHWCERSNAWQLKYPDDDRCACYRHEGDCELSDFEQGELEIIGTIHDAEYKE